VIRKQTDLKVKLREMTGLTIDSVRACVPVARRDEDKLEDAGVVSSVESTASSYLYCDSTYSK
jgi:hypothetical protein